MQLTWPEWEVAVGLGGSLAKIYRTFHANLFVALCVNILSTGFPSPPPPLSVLGWVPCVIGCYCSAVHCFMIPHLIRISCSLHALLGLMNQPDTVECNDTPNKNDTQRFCSFDIGLLGKECVPPNYGFDKGTPCLYINLNKVSSLSLEWLIWIIWWSGALKRENQVRKSCQNVFIHVAGMFLFIIWKTALLFFLHWQSQVLQGL